VAGNMQMALLESAARTTTQTVASPFDNRWHRGLMLILRISVASGTGGLSVKIRAIDPISAQAVELLADGTPIVATGTYGFVLHPDRGAASGGVRVAIAGQLPMEFDVQVVAGDGSSYTYSLSGELLI